ncbi:uncharacterized protein H6S33_008975, partial [Morchella sextelata]|uniref:uncharacterized protein n=1 Tax=Morchella sextelata TaxID=1174677 RepID=UPI001D0392CC
GLVGFPVMITEGHMTLPRTRSGQLPYICTSKARGPPGDKEKLGKEKRKRRILSASM